MPGYIPPQGYKDPYSDAELTSRMSMMPFGTYADPNGGHDTLGFAVPGMIHEPVNAFSRLLGTPSNPGTFTQGPDYGSNADDMRTLLETFTGGNAEGAMLGRGARAALPMDEASRLARAQEMGFDTSTPLYHGSPLTGETLFSDTSRPSLMGSALAGAEHLPMDPASRLARAQDQGFDTSNVLYHGTPDPSFDAFSPEFFGSNFDHSRQGVHLSPDPSEASIYAGSDGAVYPVYIRPGNQATFEGGFMDVGPYHRKLQALKDSGHDSSIESRSREHVVFDPANIRSVNAAFNPQFTGQNGLLLSRGPPPLPPNQHDPQDPRYPFITY